MATLNFFEQDVKLTRKSIRDIDDSYNNEWDLLAEICQNSVDAIRKNKGGVGSIEITIDSPRKAVKIKDNGCGIPKDDLPYLLQPFATNKEDEEGSVGEKGVGLTFVIFTSNEFQIRSSDGSSGSRARMTGARDWKNRNSKDPFLFEFEETDDLTRGTEVILEELPDDLQLFQLSAAEIIFLLRTKTAIGSTISIWQDDVPISVKLTHINLDGDITEADVDFKYLLPHEGRNAREIIDLKEYYEWRANGERNDKEKRSKLNGKLIIKYAEFQTGGRTLRAYACFVPHRRTWEDLTKTKLGMPKDEERQHSELLGFHSGVTVSVKGMPTGIVINNPIGRDQSSWPQFFVLFEDRGMSFDIGRKSLRGRQSAPLRKHAETLFKEYSALFKYIAGDNLPDPARWDRFKETQKVLELLPLEDKSGRLKLRKSPRDQESSVLGLFFEMIGCSLITELIPISSGFRRRYDLFAYWGDRVVIIEFKAKLNSILDDFKDDRKMFDEMDCIVCWDVDEDDVAEFKKESIGLSELSFNDIAEHGGIFPNATHVLTLPTANELYVIDLKKIVATPREDPSTETVSLVSPKKTRKKSA